MINNYVIIALIIIILIIFKYYLLTIIFIIIIFLYYLKIKPVDEKQIIQEIFIKNEQKLPCNINNLAENNNYTINVSSILNTGNKNLTNNQKFMNF